MNEINDQRILNAVNELLDTAYANLDDVPDEKLRRVYLLLSIELLLAQYPDVRVLGCNPQLKP